ncbi:hypothetical protein MYX07_01965 [Patescibacteria group bacterium AH-259-L07]|nr:hypothetical protein [Patescibacteria group bacterium AH-259-L07]
MSKQKLEKFDYKREYDWLIISQSYFQCALISARILNEKLSEFAISVDSPIGDCIKRIYGNYRQSPEYLIFPILFNFKHGIEIYLKSILGIQDAEFPKNHNLLDLLSKTNIKGNNKIKIKGIIEKYAFGRLLLPQNNKCDTENQFERYPQGNPYDNLELFSTIPDSGDGNNTRIMPVSIVSQEKIDELINDIEFLYENIRKISSGIIKKELEKTGIGK